MMLVFLTLINLCNLLFWLEWAVLMRMRGHRYRWVLRKWLNDEFDEIDDDEDEGDGHEGGGYGLRNKLSYADTHLPLYSFPSSNTNGQYRRTYTHKSCQSHRVEAMCEFASTFKMGNLLLLYYIEAHTDRVVAGAFCMALFERWLDHRGGGGEVVVEPRAILPPDNPKPYGGAGEIGWRSAEPLHRLELEGDLDNNAITTTNAIGQP